VAHGQCRGSLSDIARAHLDTDILSEVFRGKNDTVRRRAEAYLSQHGQLTLVGVSLRHQESSDYARDFIAQAIATEGADPKKLVLHADNGRTSLARPSCAATPFASPPPWLQLSLPRSPQSHSRVAKSVSMWSCLGSDSGRPR